MIGTAALHFITATGARGSVCAPKFKPFSIASAIPVPPRNLWLNDVECQAIPLSDPCCEGMMRQYIQITVIAASLGGFLLAQTQTKKPSAKFQVLQTPIINFPAARGPGR